MLKYVRFIEVELEFTKLTFVRKNEDVKVVFFDKPFPINSILSFIGSLPRRSSSFTFWSCFTSSSPLSHFSIAGVSRISRLQSIAFWII